MSKDVKKIRKSAVPFSVDMGYSNWTGRYGDGPVRRRPTSGRRGREALTSPGACCTDGLGWDDAGPTRGGLPGTE